MCLRSLLKKMSDFFLKGSTAANQSTTQETGSPTGVLVAPTPENYEETVRQWNYRIPHDSVNILKQHLPLTANILEAGCGTGLPDQLHYNAGYKNLWGCDLSEGMLAIAAQKNIHQELKPVDLNGPLPYGNDVFDAVTCLGTLAYINDNESALREFCRVTRTNGFIIFSQRQDLYENWQLEAVYQRLEAQGLWIKAQHAQWHPYLPGYELYGDAVKAGIFVFQKTAAPLAS